MWIVNILAKILGGIILSMPYNLFLFLIDYGIYRIRHKEKPEGYDDMFLNICISNFILISVCILLLDKTNWISG